jgi:exonuclease III
MRIVNFNIKGSDSPGKKDHPTQERSWHLLASYDPDIALVQEAETTAIPEWARQRWSIVEGDPSFLGGAYAGWGSLIAARPSLNLRPRTDLVEPRYLQMVYDYAVFGEVDLPDGTRALVSSIHVPARTITDYFDTCMPHSGRPTLEEMNSMSQPDDEPWALDLFFAVIASAVKRQRFIVGGDWNNSRLFDFDRKGKLPTATMFFTRARGAGWFDCHGQKNEERSFLDYSKRPHQLDHLFCDRKTFEKMVDCNVRVDWVVHELSDHAPLVTNFKLG